jgi:mono/diheme cytochrome c family protein
MSPRGWFFPAYAALLLVSGRVLNAADAASTARGESLFVNNCAICHQVNGVGVPGTYPPLAKSDWLAANRAGAIRAVTAGLKDDITVNGHAYSGQMPAVVINDADVAELLTYVFSAWGNAGDRVTPQEVAEVRATTNWKTFEELKVAGDFRPLPAPPPGFTLRELVRMPDFATRLASDGKGKKLYVLGQTGSLWRFDVETGNLKQLLWPKNFPGVKPGPIQTLGMTRDAQGRLWITLNQRVNATPFVLNETGIFRTSAFDAEGDPIEPKAWLRASYPWGIGPYNHGISDIKFGRDGMLYVSSGSRTDGGEEGTVPNLGKMGEVDLTGTMWRLDPKAKEPKIEIIARGIRNAYSFNWDGAGNLFTVSNGPDAHAPEEMDFVTPPKPGEPPEHHGFPYQMGDAPAGTKWYPHTPDAPPGMKFVLPVLNLGPAALMYGKPTSTFNAHSSPTGLTWLGNDWPAAVRNSFLVGRLGSFLKGPAENEEHGFDLLLMKMERRPDGTWAAHTTTFLAPLGRPIDVHLAEGRRIFILEYARQTDLKSGTGWLPGRILELRAQ